MPRAATRFTQADVARILRGADQARVPVAIDFLKDGTIRVHVNSGHSVDGEARAKSELAEKRRIVL